MRVCTGLAFAVDRLDAEQNIDQARKKRGGEENGGMRARKPQQPDNSAQNFTHAATDRIEVVSDIHVIGWPYSWPHETNGCVVFRAGTEFSESNDRG